MYCRRCGFKVNEGATECPFCHNSLIEEEKKEQVVEQTPVYYQEEKVEEPTVEKEDVNKQEYVNINETAMTKGMRNACGYINLMTNFLHHVLIASVGYLLMYVLFIFIGRGLLSLYQANGMNLDCAFNGSLEACPIEVQQVYMKITTIGQAGAELLVVVAVALVFMKYLKPLFAEFKQGRTFKWFGIGFGLMYGLNLIYSIILTVLDLNSTSTNQDLVNETIFANPVLGFIFVVIAAPLFEEVIFRLGIFRAFANKGKKMEIAGIIITTLLFAFVHMTATIESVFADISNPDYELLKSDLLSLPSYLIGAFCLTFAYYKSKNFLTPMLVHMAWNLMAFISIIGTAGLTESESIFNLIPTIIETLTRLF